MISILMPLYNGEEFLNDSISSILNQSYKNWELLIGINGHTEDGYKEISEKICNFGCDKIRIFLNTNQGKISTLNMLVKEVSYDYICLIDVDDYWFPEKLKKQLKYIEKYDVVGTDAAYFGTHLGTPKLFLGELIYEMFLFQNPIINSSVMMKKECAYWDESWEGLDDYNLWFHLLKQNKIFFNVPEILVSHRIHLDSFFNNKNDDARLKLLENISPLNDEEDEESEYEATLQYNILLNKEKEESEEEEVKSEEVENKETENKEKILDELTNNDKYKIIKLIKKERHNKLLNERTYLNLLNKLESTDWKI